MRRISWRECDSRNDYLAAHFAIFAWSRVKSLCKRGLQGIDDTDAWLLGVSFAARLSKLAPMKRCLTSCLGCLLVAGSSWAEDSPRREGGISPLMRPSLPLHRLSS